jgi:hypothetical protein
MWTSALRHTDRAGKQHDLRQRHGIERPLPTYYKGSLKWNQGVHTTTVYLTGKSWLV